MERIKDGMEWAESQMEEALELLKEWGAVPAPSGKQGLRAKKIEGWLKAQGAEEVYLDQAGNVILELGCREAENIAVFMAHMDVVFPDETPFTVREEDGKLYAPGIGDDTANLVLLMLAARKLFREKTPLRKGWGILIAANVCEEGLGNLKGSRAICEEWKEKIRAFYSLDGYLGWAVTDAVGSHRYEVRVRTEGGHSYSAFGNPNAIHILSGLIQSLYQVRLPGPAKTTFNVGTIEGGTTINSIAQEASMTYEFRSEDRNCLAYMEKFFQSTIQAAKDGGWEVDAKVLGIRPCSGEVEPEALKALEDQCRKVISRYWPGDVKTKAGSTDANIPLSMGIPACTVGCIEGGKSHTRQEWIEISSLLPGLNIAYGLMELYLEGIGQET